MEQVKVTVICAIGGGGEGGRGGERVCRLPERGARRGR